MIDLKGFADDLSRRMRCDIKFDGDEIALSLQGEGIFIRQDVECERFVLFARLAEFPREESLAAAKASISLNERSALRNAVTIGVAADDDCALVGRSFEPERIDAAIIEAETMDFTSRIPGLRAEFRAEFDKARRAPQPTLPHSDGASDAVVMKL